MSGHNYYETFIATADDCPADTGTAPELFRGKETVATIQYRLLHGKPYELTQEDVLFQTELLKQGRELDTATEQEKEAFFRTPRACLRASPLGKKYGWGLHFDHTGKVALIAAESNAYNELQQNEQLNQTRAMNTKRSRIP